MEFKHICTHGVSKSRFTVLSMQNRTFLCIIYLLNYCIIYLYHFHMNNCELTLAHPCVQTACCHHVSHLPFILLLFISSKGSHVQNYRRRQIFSSSLLKYQVYGSLANYSILIFGAVVLRIPLVPMNHFLRLSLRHPTWFRTLQTVGRIPLH